MAGMVNSRLPEASYMGGDAASPAALCIAPTRELAYQIYMEALKFSSGTYLRPVVCYGGVSVQHQLQSLERGCHILICTPGRLLDFVGRNRVGNILYQYVIEWLHLVQYMEATLLTVVRESSLFMEGDWYRGEMGFCWVSL